MVTAVEIAGARRWFRLLGLQPVYRDGIMIVTRPDSPDVWDANFATADAGADPAKLIASLDAAMSHTRWRVVMTDAMTDPSVDAALALADFGQGPPIIEMIASDDPQQHQPSGPISLHEVATDADWRALADLVRIDHREGRRTGLISDAVSEGLIAMMRARTPPCVYYLLSLGAGDIGYGMVVRCPGNLAIIENLFTLPEHRGRGAMSGFIVEVTGQLRENGCRAVFLDALVEERAKQLYARLGFRPISVARRWLKEVTSPAVNA